MFPIFTPTDSSYGGNLLTAQDLSLKCFSFSEGWDKIPLPVNRKTVSERLRIRLRELTRGEWGAQAAIAKFSAGRGFRREHISQQKLSYFLNKTPRRTPLEIDDLDDIADYFRISIGELLGETKVGELSGTEQRFVYGLRTLAPVTQEHFLAILEAASLTARIGRGFALKDAPGSATTTAVPQGVSLYDSAAPDVRASETLAGLQHLATEFAHRLAAFATGANQPPAVRATQKKKS